MTIDFFEPYLGEIAALSAAFLWAISSVIYSRLGLKIAPLQLNLSKGIIAIALIVATLAWQKTAFTKSERPRRKTTGSL